MDKSVRCTANMRRIFSKEEGLGYHRTIAASALDTPIYRRSYFDNKGSAAESTISD